MPNDESQKKLISGKEVQNFLEAQGSKASRWRQLARGQEPGPERDDLMRHADLVGEKEIENLLNNNSQDKQPKQSFRGK